MIIPIAEFAPDQPDVASNTSDTIVNVIPLTQNSYGPMAGIASYANALSARCQGALSFQAASGDVHVFSGDATKLYRLTSASLTPADVSILGGYTADSAGVWSITSFGERIIATDSNDLPQSYVDGTSALFANLITTGTTTLRAKYVSTVRDFVVFGNTVDATDGTRKQRVWWSAINDPTNFPTPGTLAAANAQSDYQDLLGTHGELMGIAGNLGPVDAAIFFERAVYRMIYVGLPDIFSFQRVGSSRGLIAPNALVQMDSTAYHLAEDGFYAFDGSTSRPIGKNKIDRYFFDDFDARYIDLSLIHI